MRGISEKNLARARSVKQRIASELKSRAAVTGIGVGYKLRNGRIVQRCAIRIHVEKKFLPHYLPEDELFPKEIEGYPVDVLEAVYYPHNCEPRTDRYTDLVGGIAITNRNNYPYVGTLGYRVYDCGSDEEYLLGSWHVLYGRPGSQDGEPVDQPRPLGQNTNYIGKSAFGIRDSRVDCALVKLDGYRSFIPMTEGFPNLQIRGITEARVGMEVIKSGVTGLAYGTIEGIDDVTVKYADGNHLFNEQIHILNIPGKTFCVSEGDSGSIWIDSATHCAVGLHVGGSGNFAIANHMHDVIDTLEKTGIRVIF